MDRMTTYPASSVLAVATTVLFPSSGDAGGPARWCPKALRIPDACGAVTFHTLIVSKRCSLLPLSPLPHSYCLRVLAVPSEREDWGLVPSTHMVAYSCL